MTKEELLAKIGKHGGKIEPIKQTCHFETFGKNIFDFCIQPKDSPSGLIEHLQNRITNYLQMEYPKKI